MITLVAGQNTLNVQLTAVYVPPAVASLVGTVTSAATGLSIAGVKVTLGTVVSYTDANGDYIFVGIPPGSYSITFEKAGYTTAVM